MFHLPDIPNVGYATDREKRLSDEIMLFMREIERDRFRLLTIVIEGPDKWRKVATTIWRGLRPETDAIDEIYRYFVLQAAQPHQQRELLAAMKNPDKWREAVHRIMPDVVLQRDTVASMARFGIGDLIR